MSLRVAHCIPTDGPTIGSLETSTVSRFLQLQLGDATPASLENWLAHDYSSAISSTQTTQDEANGVFFKVVDQKANDDEEGAMISFVTWELPEDDNAPKSGGGNNLPLPSGINFEFIYAASYQMRQMHNRVLNGRKCFSEFAKHLLKSKV